MAVPLWCSQWVSRGTSRQSLPSSPRDSSRTGSWMDHVDIIVTIPNSLCMSVSMWPNCPVVSNSNPYSCQTRLEFVLLMHRSATVFSSCVAVGSHNYSWVVRREELALLTVLSGHHSSTDRLDSFARNKKKRTHLAPIYRSRRVGVLKCWD